MFEGSITHGPNEAVDATATSSPVPENLEKQTCETQKTYPFYDPHILPVRSCNAVADSVGVLESKLCIVFRACSLIPFLYPYGFDAWHARFKSVLYSYSCHYTCLNHVCRRIQKLFILHGLWLPNLLFVWVGYGIRNSYGFCRLAYSSLRFDVLYMVCMYTSSCIPGNFHLVQARRRRCSRSPHQRHSSLPTRRSPIGTDGQWM